MIKNIWYTRYDVYDWINYREHWRDKERYFPLMKVVDRYMPYKVDIDSDFYYKLARTSIWQEVDKWCKENFYDRYCIWGNRIQCRNEFDAFAFKLRWL